MKKMAFLEALEDNLKTWDLVTKNLFCDAGAAVLAL